MNDIIQETAEHISKEFGLQMELLVGGGHDISKSAIKFKEVLDQAGARIVERAMEELNQALVESKDRKTNWVVKNKADRKTLCTQFGEVRYVRTCFQNKTTGECCYLADEMAGIEPHERMDASLKAEMITEAIDRSYKKSAGAVVPAMQFSAQTVMNAIRELGKVENREAKCSLLNEGRRSVPILYIEADEDHVALQDGRCAEPKLVYVHEGRRKVGKNRWELVNVRCFGGMYPKSEDLWLEVADYLEQAYEMKDVERVYLSGDGATWIKSGVQWIQNSEFVLDGYHLLKYVKKATGHMPYMERYMWEYLNGGDRRNLRILFDAIVEGTEDKRRKEAVYEARSYMFRHWEAIKRRQGEAYGGCSAESHVSHIYSARMSSRPLGWSVEGADQMARLRVFSKNGGNIYDLVMERKLRAKREMREEQRDRRIQLKRRRTAYYKNVENLTVLGIGKRTNLFRAIHAVRAV